MLQHLTFEINHRKWRVELLISEIPGSVLDYLVYHFPPIFEISCYLLHKHYLNSNHKNLLAKNKNTIYHNKPSYIRHQWHSRFCKKYCIKRWEHLDL